MKTKLQTIQKRNNLNHVFCMDEEHPINKGHHMYLIKDFIDDLEPSFMETSFMSIPIRFQNGPRKEADSKHGALDGDLLEIVRHRLQSFQKGPYATRENAIALTHIEEALLWLCKRTEDRAEDGKLGTNKI